MTTDSMTVEEAKNIIDEMYQDKHKILEENNVINLAKIDDIKFTNLEYASVRMLRKVQSLECKLENLQKENELAKVAKEKVKELLENSISKDLIKEKIERYTRAISDSNDGDLKHDLRAKIKVLEEKLKEVDVNVNK